MAAWGTQDGSAEVRADELAALHRTLDDLAAGRSAIVELAGEPGSGKTTLLNGLRREAGGRGVRLRQAHGTSFEAGTALALVDRVLGEPVKHRLPVPPESGIARWRRAELYPRLRELLAEQASGGLVLLFDDAHHADPESAAFLSHLIDRPVDEALLVVLAHRPRQTPVSLRAALARGVRSGVLERIALPPLTVDQTARLVGRPPGCADVAALHDASEGNPFYLRALAEDTPGQESVHSLLLLDELRDLSDDAQRVLSAAAVLGTGCDLDALATVSELDRVRACGAAAEAQHHDVLRAEPGTPVLRFRHPLLRHAVYRSTPACRRNGLHRAALAVLTARGASAVERAWHVEQSLGLLEQSDLAVLADAAADVVAARPAEAVRLLELAARLATDASTRAELRLRLARALIADGRLERAHEELRNLVATAEPPVRGAAAAECAMVDCVLGHYADANVVLSVELAATPPGRPDRAVPLLLRRALIGLFDGDLPDDGHVSACLREARQDGDRNAEAGALALLALSAAYRGDVRPAFDLTAACRAITDGQTDAELAQHGDRLTLLGWTERMLAEFTDAERHLLRHVSLLARDGVTCMLPVALMGLSTTHQAVARLADAQRTAGEAVTAARHLGSADLREIAEMLESAYLAWTERGPAGELAVARAEQAVAVRLRRNWWFGVQSILLLARILEIEGQNERCIALVLSAGGGPDLPNVPPAIRPRCFEMLACAAAAMNDPAAAEWAARTDAAAHGLGQPNHLGSALLADGHRQASSGQHAAAARCYLQAAELFGGLGMIGAQIRALMFGARAAQSAGHAGEAVAHLTMVKDLALQCGAVVLHEEAERLRAELATGSGPRQAETPAPQEVDLSVLTNREREIAIIAGTGKRTREIAAELSLSPRTVDLHLTRVYRKLNVASRAALANLMARAS